MAPERCCRRGLTPSAQPAVSAARWRRCAAAARERRPGALGKWSLGPVGGRRGRRASPAGRRGRRGRCFRPHREGRGSRTGPAPLAPPRLASWPLMSFAAFSRSLPPPFFMCLGLPGLRTPSLPSFPRLSGLSLSVDPRAPFPLLSPPSRCRSVREQLLVP